MLSARVEKIQFLNALRVLKLTLKPKASPSENLYDENYHFFGS